ncbi:MAG: ATP-dependent zinc protease [Arcobacter sp.]|nr:ATP-dependent zinc protease [Arcobacter sp.]
MKTKVTTTKKIIGHKELISIIDLELFDLDAKIDTGADGNALHCDEIKIDEYNNNLVHFKLLDAVHPSYHDKDMILPLHKLKKIKSSNGQTELRPSVKLSVLFMGKKYKTIVSLTNRADMKYPMLIGRRFLNGKFLVDTEFTYLGDKK